MKSTPETVLGDIAKAYAIERVVLGVASLVLPASVVIIASEGMQAVQVAKAVNNLATRENTVHVLARGIIIGDLINKNYRKVVEKARETINEAWAEYYGETNHPVNIEIKSNKGRQRISHQSRISA